jgi:hypothetical protein
VVLGVSLNWIKTTREADQRCDCRSIANRLNGMKPKAKFFYKSLQPRRRVYRLPAAVLCIFLLTAVARTCRPVTINQVVQTLTVRRAHSISGSSRWLRRIRQEARSRVDHAVDNSKLNRRVESSQIRLLLV